jgi:hypothetical protein
MINQIGIYYNTATVVVENNSVGGAVLNSLSNDMGYEAVYYESKKSSTKLGIKMGPSNRPIFLEAMQNRLMNGTVRINSHRLVNELKTFIYSPQKKRAEAIKGKHDDAIMALCLALYVRDERIRGLPLNIEYAEQSILAKNAPMDDIKKEILDGGVSDWFEIRTGDGFSTEERQDSRKNSPILKEFGW